MFSSWSALHAHLLAQTSRLHVHQLYQSVQCDPQSGLPAGDIGALLGSLHDPGENPEIKNRMLRSLIASGQRSCELSQTVTLILLLALWPGLCAARARLRRRWRGGLSDLDAELVGRMTLNIRELDLDRVDRVAATLLRNVERDITRDLFRQAREAPFGRALEDIADGFPGVPVFAAPNLTPVSGHRALEAELRRLIGDDAALVMAVAVCGYSQREAAVLLGLTHDAARKRYQRACARLRNTW